MPLNESQRALLLASARQSIAYGLDHGGRPAPNSDAPAPLDAPGASFVTLRREGQLRGCIGTLEAYRPLFIDIAGNACAAAFHDPRFTPLRHPELEALILEISVLSPPEPLDIGNEQELLGRLRPGVDGLILDAGGRRGTFLPGVWDSLPDPRDFLHHLKLKAGLPGDYRLDTVRVWRYTTECFGETRR